MDISGDELIFRPKTEEETRFIESRRLYDWDNRLFEQFYGCVFHQATSLDPFGTSLEKSICHVCVLWEGEIPFRIVPASSYA